MQHSLGAGEAEQTQERVDLAAEPPAPHEHEPLDVFGILVGELHRDAAAERLAHHRGALVPEGDEQVAQRARKGPERVVALRLVRAPVPEQIGRDHGEALGEPGHHLPPGRGAAGYAVDQQQDRAGAGGAVGDPLVVD